MTRKILIASADKQVRISISLLWDHPDFEIYTVKSAEEALGVLKDFRFDQVIVDTNVPAMGGRRLKTTCEKEWPNTPILLITSFNAIRTSEDMLRFGAADFVLDKEEIRPLLVSSVLLKLATEELTKLKRCFMDSLALLVGLLELRDPFKSGESHYVFRYVQKIAKRMELSQDAIDAITVAAMFRDIWRYMLHRPLHNVLTDEEQTMIRRHTSLSVQLLEEIDFPWDVKSILYHHHERYDGTGYPDGIKGRAIPLGARILAVVDSYQAMIGNRPYRTPRTKEDAVKELVAKAGTQFDPEVTEIFVDILQSEEEAVWDLYKNKETILILDGNSGDLSLLRVKLSAEGYKVLGAISGAEGLEVLKDVHPSVIICDTDLTDMDGFRFYDQLQVMPDQKETIPFIFMSDRGARFDRRDALLMGAEDFLYKPVNLRDLLIRLDIILKRLRENRVQVVPMETGIYGRLQDLGIPEIIQILDMGRKTAMITIHGADRRFIYMEQGMIRHAEANGLTGEEAFLTILRIRDARFSITHGVTTDQRTIFRGNLDLLLDCLRRIDEERHLESQSPKGEAQLAAPGAEALFAPTPLAALPAQSETTASDDFLGEDDLALLQALGPGGDFEDADD